MNNLDDMHICYGSCQMIGAASAFLSVKNAAVIFNSPRWCALTAERELKLPRLHYEKRLYCTEVKEDTLVYGVESSLNDTLDEVFAEFEPELIAVVTSCSMSLIGDDVKAICQRYGNLTDVIALDAGGLTGGFASGYAKAQLELLKLTNFPETSAQKQLLVNILGASTAYPSWQGDIAELKRLLQLYDIKVNLVFGVDSVSFKELNKIGEASLNIVVDADLGLAAAKWLKENRQMDYVVAGWPYGFKQTYCWLQSVAEALHMEIDLGCLQEEMASLSESMADYCSWIEHNMDDCYLQQLVLSLPGERAQNIIKALEQSHLGLLYCQQIFVKDTVMNNYQTWHDVSQISDLPAKGMRLLLASERERFLVGGYARTLYLNMDMPAPQFYDLWKPYVGIRGWQNFVAAICEQFITLKSIENKI